VSVAKRVDSRIKDVAHMRSPRGSARSLVILGCQRSGTNALLGCLEEDRDAKVFPEFSELNVPSRKPSRNSIRWTVRLRPLDQVAARINRLRYPLAVLKPLVESRYIGELLEGVPRSRVVWLFRHYQDVAESNARTFGAHVHRLNLAPIAAGDPSNWRSEGVSTDVRETVAHHYHPDMDPIDGGALFWWARNRLLFDEGYESDPRVRPLRYARFVADPANVLAELYEHAGVAFPGEDIARSVTPKFVGCGAGHRISPDIHTLCERLWERLLDLD
jgi:hypothetical protein